VNDKDSKNVLEAAGIIFRPKRRDENGIVRS